MAKAFAAMPGSRVAVKDDSDVLLNGAAKTATDNTAAVNPRGAQRIGFFVDVDTVAGTSPSLTITFEYSPDKGTTWVELPGAANSQTQAALAAITAAGESFEWYEFVGDVEFSRVRAVLTIAGTSPSFTFGQVYWIFSNFPEA